jgi:ribonuclease HI
MSIRLEFECTNNQVEYEALLSGLEVLDDMGIDKVKIFGDSKLVVEQINEGSQCFAIQGEGNESAGSGQASTKDWRQEVTGYINDPSCTKDQKITRQALKYTVIDGRLFHRTMEGLLLM